MIAGLLAAAAQALVTLFKSDRSRESVAIGLSAEAAILVFLVLVPLLAPARLLDRHGVLYNALCRLAWLHADPVAHPRLLGSKPAPTLQASGVAYTLQVRWRPWGGVWELALPMLLPFRLRQPLPVKPTHVHPPARCPAPRPCQRARGACACCATPGSCSWAPRR